jgi:hypothetical protein
MTESGHCLPSRISKNGHLLVAVAHSRSAIPLPANIGHRGPPVTAFVKPGQPVTVDVYPNETTH